MGAIIRHSPITFNGPIYSTYGDTPYPVGVHCTCCPKGSTANSTAHANPTHGGHGRFCLPVLEARHEHLHFPICTPKKRDCLSLPSVSFSLKLTVAALHNHQIDFLGGCVERLPILTAP